MTEKQLNLFIRFIIVFAAVFLVCYFGALMLTGLSVPGAYYSHFVAVYLNIATGMRSALILCSKGLLSLWGIQTYRVDEYTLREVNGRGIKLVYSCLGFGVMSFWTAYIAAATGPIKRRIIWLLGGLLFIFTINVVRISLVLKAGNSNRQFPFGWDHHTWFGIIAYFCIFLMILLFEYGLKRGEGRVQRGDEQKAIDNRQ